MSALIDFTLSIKRQTILLIKGRPVRAQRVNVAITVSSIYSCQKLKEDHQMIVGVTVISCWTMYITVASKTESEIICLNWQISGVKQANNPN